MFFVTNRLSAIAIQYLGVLAMRFPKQRRLLHRSEFVWVQKQGKRYDLGQLLACVCHTPEQLTRVGITTSKRVGNAVVRNRIRRLIREAVRRYLLSAISSEFTIVLIAKSNLSVNIHQSQIDLSIHKLIDSLTQYAQKIAHRERIGNAPPNR
jgi:ribonuclease P protein component